MRASTKARASIAVLAIPRSHFYRRDILPGRFRHLSPTTGPPHTTLGLPLAAPPQPLLAEPLAERCPWALRSLPSNHLIRATLRPPAPRSVPRTHTSFRSRSPGPHILAPSSGLSAATAISIWPAADPSAQPPQTPPRSPRDTRGIPRRPQAVRRRKCGSAAPTLTGSRFPSPWLLLPQSLPAPGEDSLSRYSNPPIPFSRSPACVRDKPGFRPDSRAFPAVKWPLET